MSDKIYDILKDVAQIILPGFIVLYIAVAGYWGWSCTEQVAGTLTAIDTFIGVVLKSLKSKYDKEDKTNE